MSVLNLTPTAEQQAILDCASNSTHNIMIEARAGTGKTATLLRLLALLKGTTCLMAFNRAIADELRERSDQLPFAARVNLDIGTVHSLGNRALGKALGRRPKLNGGKINFILKDLLAGKPADQKLFQPVTYTIRQLVSAAKNNGFGIKEAAEPFPTLDDPDAWQALLEHHNWDIELEELNVPVDKAIALAQQALTISNNQDSIIDFDDMIYLPLLRDYKLPTYANVLIDEAQDISATRREMAFRMLADAPSRLIAVGDEFQAIYGFTGADAESLRNIGRRAAAQRFPLTTCWRCDGAIIEEAQKQVPDINARPDAPAGRVTTVTYSTIEAALLGKLPAEKLAELDATTLPQEGDAILCRLNRPNVAAALMLIRAGKRARIEGRDLGRRLLNHVKEAQPLYASKTLHELIIDVEDWGEVQSRLLASKGRESSAAFLEDEVACAVLLMERCLEKGQEDFSSLEWEIDCMFADDIPPGQVVTLSSVHKAKGREWNRVFILGRFDYMPFWRATQPWEKQQEENLIYVATTRARKELFLVGGVQSALDKKKEER